MAPESKTRDGALAVVDPVDPVAGLDTALLEVGEPTVTVVVAGGGTALPLPHAATSIAVQHNAIIPAVRRTTARSLPTT
jgi:hypothetical protein